MLEKQQALRAPQNIISKVYASDIYSETIPSILRNVTTLKDPPFQSTTENGHLPKTIDNLKLTPTNNYSADQTDKTSFTNNGNQSPVSSTNKSSKLTSQNSADNVSRDEYCSEFENNYRYFCLSIPSGTSEREQMIDFCTAYEKNCLQSLPTLQAHNTKNLEERKSNAKSEWFGSFIKEIDNDHHSEDDDQNFDSGELKVPDENRLPSKVEISIYCDDYSKHYLYFCLLPLKKSSVLRAKLLIFCPAYEKICNNRSRETGAPTDPKNKPNDPFVVFQELKDPKKAAEKLQQNKNPVPCTPNCDERIWPHCTAECKCDYMYPYVQNFCNPPPMPLFLQTCRLWYRGCPKYEQFHYASQFIHSKANKGKVLPGIADNRPHTNPNIATIPIQRESPLLTDENEYVNWRTTEHQQQKKFERPSWTNRLEHKSDNQNIANIWKKIQMSSEQIDYNLKSRIPRDIWDEIAKRANDLPFEDRTMYSKLLRSDAFPFESASDSSVHRFDQFSDSRGLVHQARTKSPFTKPGLWEPNPDNPHNRDHANKFYYAPVSASADWLSGQLAWGGHWAVPAAGVGGTNGYSTVHFPSIGSFLGIDDDYD